MGQGAKNWDLVLVFVARKNTCDFVANMLNRCGTALTNKVHYTFIWVVYVIVGSV